MLKRCIKQWLEVPPKSRLAVNIKGRVTMALPYATRKKHAEEKLLIEIQLAEVSLGN